ncbi:MAG: glycosyltransferase family 2 protein [Kaistella sp.]|nr:glycosyltransferase family 2 protein [Kaistella sp.]
MNDLLIEILEFVYLKAIIYYSIALMISYIVLLIFAGISIDRNLFFSRLRHKEDLLQMHNAPGVSIITAAFNESATITANVNSLLNLSYPKFEVIIVNDGSTDDTLEKMISHFELIEVTYYYEKKLDFEPIKGFYKSSNKAYANLLVIDKVNGKSKADAINAGLNVSNFPYFLNTDVDCVLHRDTLLYFMSEILSERKRVIAIGATLRMCNSFVFKNGILKTIQLPKNLWVRFQELEYVRSYLLGKMGWSYFNAVPNVSGGLGLFEKEIVMKVGGYDSKSFGEDMDIIIRICRYMLENKLEYKIKYIPQVLCWTEGPDSLKILIQQRVRWSRGLWRIYGNNKKVFLNPKYKKLGLVIYPYNLFFEVLAPIIEFSGVVFMISYYIIYQQGIILILLFIIYFFSALVSTFSVLYNQFIHNYYKSHREVYLLIFTAFLEPLIFHPVIVFSALKGYANEIIRTKHVWGDMNRKGFKQNEINEK